MLVLSHRRTDDRPGGSLLKLNFTAADSRRHPRKPGALPSSYVAVRRLGGFGAHAGGAPVINAALRVTFWGALAMALTAGVGALFGAVVSSHSTTVAS